MITCNIMGGLGNQLFQIFATISYAMKCRQQFKFLNLTQLGGGATTVRYTFWNTFFANLKPFLISKLPDNIEIIRENGFTFNELPLSEMMNKNKDFMIHGYFQSQQYFADNYGTICRLIGLGKMKDELLSRLEFSNEYLKNCISMHFRIGDYKNLQHFHPLTTYRYYERSLEFLKSKYDSQEFTIMYFCEDNDIEQVLETINKLTIQFPNYTFIRGENSLADWEQMLLMSCCHHNIIANSSFSWWAAYFNFHTDKTICYPSVWFGPTINNDTRDLCPPNWTKIKV